MTPLHIAAESWRKIHKQLDDCMVITGLNQKDLSLIFGANYAVFQLKLKRNYKLKS